MSKWKRFASRKFSFNARMPKILKGVTQDVDNRSHSFGNRIGHFFIFLLLTMICLCLIFFATTGYILLSMGLGYTHALEAREF
jgi:hypothetical protein